ncbi:MAG: PUA domain-containing protein, partial [Rhizobiaceae bacterium]
RDHPIKAVLDGERATWFDAQAVSGKARKTWIAGQLEPAGRIVLDEGAVSALQRGKSLLPAGVTRVDGNFSRGDAVTIAGPDGSALGHGLIAYNDSDARKIMGLRSDKWEEALGYEGRSVLIHRDDMALGLAARHGMDSLAADAKVDEKTQG